MQTNDLVPGNFRFLEHLLLLLMSKYYREIHAHYVIFAHSKYSFFLSLSLSFALYRVAYIDKHMRHLKEAGLFSLSRYIQSNLFPK